MRIGGRDVGYAAKTPAVRHWSKPLNRSKSRRASITNWNSLALGTDQVRSLEYGACLRIRYSSKRFRVHFDNQVSDFYAAVATDRTRSRDGLDKAAVNALVDGGVQIDTYTEVRSMKREEELRELPSVLAPFWSTMERSSDAGK